MLLRRSVQSSVRLAIVLALALTTWFTLDAHAQDRFKIDKVANRIDILDGDALVTSYHYRSGSKPILWPLIGPDKKRFSREYPMVQKMRNMITPTIDLCG
ncbi:MAG: hypothetical protein MUD03_13545 [Pirellula sp.]|nr:hypothetical protein [Pirellula sp.]